MLNAIIGWVRDKSGKVTKRTLNDICNAITSMVGGGHADADGLMSMTPQVMEVWYV